MSIWHRHGALRYVVMQGTGQHAPDRLLAADNAAAGVTAFDLDKPVGLACRSLLRMSGLDFWIGDWDAAWEGGAGRNTVSRELGGRVFVERFTALGAEAFSGMSLSVQDAASGTWRQTWADSAGSYWTFVGAPQDDGSFVFGTPDPVDDERVFKRMVFFDIAEDAFRWRWEFSSDAVSWQERWAISYRRR